MFAIVPLLVSMLMFYVANQTGGALAYLGSTMMLSVGIICALCEVSAQRQGSDNKRSSDKTGDN